MEKMSRNELIAKMKQLTVKCRQKVRIAQKNEQIARKQLKQAHQRLENAEDIGPALYSHSAKSYSIKYLIQNPADKLTTHWKGNYDKQIVDACGDLCWAHIVPSGRINTNEAIMKYYAIESASDPRNIIQLPRALEIMLDAGLIALYPTNFLHGYCELRVSAHIQKLRIMSYKKSDTVRGSFDPTGLVTTIDGFSTVFGGFNKSLLQIQNVNHRCLLYSCIIACWCTKEKIFAHPDSGIVKLANDAVDPTERTRFSVDWWARETARAKVAGGRAVGDLPLVSLKVLHVYLEALGDLAEKLTEFEEKLYKDVWSALRSKGN
jgi:hypothetical protein